MATAAQINKFIALMIPCAQKAYRELGKVKPSVCIAMACVESGYGTAGSCRHNSFLGQKVGTGKTATKYWDGTFKTWRTKEEYKIGVHTVITDIADAFRTYSSMEQCVFNYYELLNTKLYSEVKADADYITQMQQIKSCGYMTSSTEVNSVINIIRRYKLTQYDEAEENTAGQITAGSMPTLKCGSKGDAVRYLQSTLNLKGYFLTIDGIFGTITTAAVLDFQKKNGLLIDGIVGKKTWKVLLG